MGRLCLPKYPGGWTPRADRPGDGSVLQSDISENIAAGLYWRQQDSFKRTTVGFFAIIIGKIDMKISRKPKKSTDFIHLFR